MKALGLVAQRDGLLHPTDAGRDLLENEFPDSLVEVLLVRVFPFALLLRLVGEGGRKPASLAAELQQIYPRWTTTMAPSSALNWTRDLGLVEKVADGLLRLTPYGENWAKRLPAQLPMPTVSAFDETPDAEEEEDDGAADPSEARNRWPGVEAIETAFQEDAHAKQLVVDRSQLEGIHAAWHCNTRKRFVIVSGLSGTGKTEVIRTYARLYCEALSLPVSRHLQIVPVSPDWRDPSGLFGYFNALHEEPTFQVEPALRLILAASRDPENPYFLVLDEMNLARPERYFAPMLSSMETGTPLTLHCGERSVNGVEPRISWPTNLFIAGTVNMDETTHPFSDKVLDRAFTFEFWEVDLPAFFERRTDRSEWLEKVLLDLLEILRPIRRHFGYRTAGEILAFVGTGSEKSRASRLDQAIFSKVLPKLRGEDSPPLRAALEKALALFEQEKLDRSAAKLAEMISLLSSSGLTKFWA